jgi:hypothetical protein
MRRHTNDAAIRRARSADVEWTRTDWKIACGIFAPYIFLVVLLFVWLMWA